MLTEVLSRRVSWPHKGCASILQAGKIIFGRARRILRFALSEHDDAEVAYGAMAIAAVARDWNTAGVISVLIKSVAGG